jgi:hypothetical protein
MARHKRGEYLDKSTRNHLDALDKLIALESQNQKPRQPDEFTALDYMQKMTESGIHLSISALKDRLIKLQNQGVIESRLLPQKGSITRLYRVI